VDIQIKRSGLRVSNSKVSSSTNQSGGCKIPNSQSEAGKLELCAPFNEKTSIGRIKDPFRPFLK